MPPGDMKAQSNTSIFPRHIFNNDSLLSVHFLYHIRWRMFLMWTFWRFHWTMYCICCFQHLLWDHVREYIKKKKSLLLFQCKQRPCNWRGPIKKEKVPQIHVHFLKLSLNQRNISFPQELSQKLQLQCEESEREFVRWSFTLKPEPQHTKKSWRHFFFLFEEDWFVIFTLGGSNLPWPSPSCLPSAENKASFPILTYFILLSFNIEHF